MRVVIALALCGSLGCTYHPSPIAPSSEPTPVVVTPPPQPATPPPVLAPPMITVDVSVNPPVPFVSDPITFSVSSGNGRAPLSYAWTFGDGETAEGSETTRTHAYSSDGVKMIRIVVTDADGRSGTGSREIEVHRVSTPSRSVPPPPPAPPAPPPPPPPAPSLSATLTCTALAHGSPSPCNVNATYGGVLLPSAAVTNVAYDWGDGLTSANGVVSTHTYANAGSYNVFATVTATTVDGPKTATTTAALIVP